MDGVLKKGETIEFSIEKLVYGGEAMGKYNDITVFVPDAAPGDRVRAEVISVKKNYARAVLREIVEPSEKRVKPFCALANICGGCQWQYIDYEEQLRAKQKIVEETLEKIGGFKTEVKNIIASPVTREYRCKVQFPAAQTKVSKRFLVGYYKKGTHEIINIKHCPVQPGLIDQVTAFLRERAKELKLAAYNEKTGKGLIRHFVYRYSSTNHNFVLTIVINSDKTPENLLKLCNAVKEIF
ncbi:MAG: TRAM domain-containing protein, partial [Candidatus Lokiarchaeota archaeon]|nr:TRAM domain-containing protein [Candidatus Lokiarchaeota archaeon]